MTSFAGSSRGGPDRQMASNLVRPAARPLVAMLRSLAALCLAICLLAAPSEAQTKTQDSPPPEVETLMKLLSEPRVQEWLHARDDTVPGATAAAHEHATTVSHPFADYVAAVRNHIYGHAAALKSLPSDLGRAGELLVTDIAESGALGLLGLLALLAGLSVAAKLVYRRVTSSYARQIEDEDGATSRTRLVNRSKRFALALGEIAAIGAAATLVFLALHHWPDVIEQIILAFLLASIAWLIVRAVSRYLLAQQGGFRIVPLSDASAAFWSRQIAILASLGCFGWAAVLAVCVLGFPDAACDVLEYALGLAILAVLTYSLHAQPEEGFGQGERRPQYIALTLTLVLLWCLWAAGATPIFLLGCLLLGLAYAIRLTKRSIDHCFIDGDGSMAANGNPRLTAVLVERTIRFVLIMAALGLALWIWEVDFAAIDSVDSRVSRLIHGGILAGIILLAANFVWSMLRTLIDQKIEKTRAVADPAQVNRFATLLPVLRNFLWAAIAAFAVLMALSELGIEVGPLIAGAGVVGVAIGFGAQTLVKDIISGIFYLFDDAFRVGEYIESGSYKGTVESFSLRSVKLRHNRGPIFTVPFGVLGAIQNMSRDWVIDKMKLTITYDSDVEKARKIIKRIGLELAEDPELKMLTLEPLKMQGVQDFGDYGVILTLKLKTKPGQQFAVRRRAMVLIKKEFEANGIKFASPSVQITGQTAQSSDLQGAATAPASILPPRPSPAS
jgi:small-conductance mechanosensitive channel